jgi:hypothetical protein
MIVGPRRLGIPLLFFGFLAGVLARAAEARGWPQWGSNPAHQGASAAVGQPLVSVLTDIVCDPFVELEKAESGGLLVHYAVPLLDAKSVYLVFKSGTYASCLGNPFRPFPLPPGGMKTPRTVGPR